MRFELYECTCGELALASILRNVSLLNFVVQVKNRESAARSRQRKQEYTADLEEQVNQLKEQNKALLQRVIDACSAPEDKHSGKVDGERLRRTRSGI